MSKETPVVHSDPEILGGTPVFVGTRVPVKSLYDLARTNRVKEPRPLMPKVLDALRIVKAGEVVSVGD